MNIRIVLSNLLVLLLLSACGGSSSGSASIGGSNPDGSDADIYSVSSYTNADTSDADLSGTWIYLEESDIEYISETSPLSSQRYAGNLRSVISIVDNGDSTITLVMTSVQKKLPVGAGLLSFDLGGLEFVGQVINNRLIEGEVVSYEDDFVVHSSAATLVKISDSLAFEGEGVVGHFNLDFVDYQDDSYSGQLNNQPVHTFSQMNFELTDTVEGESTTHSTSNIVLISISDLSVSLSGEGEDWLDSYYVDLQNYDDSNTLNKGINFDPAYSSHMRNYSRQKWVDIEVIDSTPPLLSGSAASQTSSGNNADIEIHFEIRL